jgi:hypothetical protein
MEIINNLIAALESVLTGLVGDIDFEDIDIAGVAGSLKDALSGVIQLLIETISGLTGGAA